MHVNIFEHNFEYVEQISLKQFGKSYADTLSIYSDRGIGYDGTYNLVILQPFVMYEGENDYCYGEETWYNLEFAIHSCPDNNHPHAIDLDLPSGTKWCCTNVGATSPEQYGGYFAWGETIEKSLYNEVSYAYCSGEKPDNLGLYRSNLEYKDIGSDIAGTDYDVAHVMMGGTWRMPSFDVVEELYDNCSFVFGWSMNDVPGILIVGKVHGNYIFLPFAGYRSHNDLIRAEWAASYWTSSLNPYNDKNSARTLRYSTDGYIFDEYRYYGNSVRAVCR